MNRRLLLLALVLAACATTGKTLTTAEIAEACAAVEPSAMPADVAEAERLEAEGRTWTNQEIRRLYVCRAGDIGTQDVTWRADGLTAEERARRAYDIRHGARMTARAMMRSEAQVKQLQARDQRKYGNPDGPTFEQLVEKAEAEGVTGDAVYEGIVTSSQRTDPATNKLLGISG